MENFKNKTNGKIDKFNLSKNLCNHLIGEEHHVHHRLICGAVIMAIGVLTARFGMLFEGAAYHVFADIVGYTIHGIGAIPYIHLFEKA